KPNLLRKTISSDSSCPWCNHARGDATHLAILCPCAAQVWSILGLQTPTCIGHIWDTPTPVGLDINIWPTVALIILWKLWDSRNARVFRNEINSPLDTIRNVVSDFTLWVFRFKDSVSREAAVS
uniref:Reverse transcriptase zinc-binding domain-containing protein n=1 Tax=Aegilops tauschii subsp. strangulata TaxID=200361 RepID=A0A453A680_AEGTS